MQTTVKTYAGQVNTLFALAVMGICGAILWQQIATIPPADIFTTFHAITPLQWALALAATCLSFLAVGRYDAVWHQRLQTNVAAYTARRSGMAAIAIGQTIGASAVTGGFVRWQLLPDLAVKTTTAITVGVSMSFLTCWAIVALVAGVGLGLLPVSMLAAACAIVATVMILRSHLPRRFHFRSEDAFRLLSLTIFDLGFASLALWVLIPDATLALMLPVLGAYVIALGAGLISNAPGGIGAFDLALIALLPMVPEADMLAAILAFRIVYYLVPALVAAGYAVATYLRPQPDQTLTQAPISDLCHQGAHLTKLGTTEWVVRRHLLGTVAIEPQGCTPHLHRFTQTGFGFRGLYKADTSLALQARNQGWAVRRIADDAIITPHSWSEAGPKKRQLRRKLKQASGSGVQVRLATTPLPHDTMDQIAKDWAQTHGGELGYAMGQYGQDYVARQRVYLIWADAALTGFITVQTRACAWAIDLIRHTADMPAGAIHAAYVQIIADAKTQDIATLSLGAVPTANTQCKYQTRVRAHKAGLVQFKQSFQPAWKPLYHAAPTRLQWALSMLHIIWRVQRPIPRWIGRWRVTFTKLIIISPSFHLNTNRGHEMPTQRRARANLTKGGPHDQPICNASR